MSRGGARPGAGRPKGQGKYKEPTKPVRVPESLVDDVMKLIGSKDNALPLYGSTVSARTPSPAYDHVEDRLDLGTYLVSDPSMTFLVRVAGDSMLSAGIHPGDLLIVDRGIEPKHGKIVIAAVDGELTVKRLHRVKGQTLLMPENDNYEPITFLEGNDMVIWGVVTNVIHSV